MIVVLLILHGLLAVGLLGAITHQALSVLPLASAKGQRTFIDRFRGVNAPAYATPIVVLFVFTAIGGALLYPQYRIDVRPALEDMQNAAANGVFEIKEHLIAIGLGVLPAYWYFWQQPLNADASARRALTWLLAFFVWWGFIVGHVLNNIRGLLP
ncbi:MAG TPA: hypothetical protein VKB36_25490 [Vicinamibacterales bacterium]|nr:hypothetical protein [Vicinamibacterales bacterium]